MELDSRQIGQLLLVIGLLFTIIGCALISTEINLWEGKHNKFKKINMNMTKVEVTTRNGRQTIEEWDNWGLEDYPYKIIDSSMLCKAGSTEIDYSKATKFIDPSRIREEFAKNSKFWSKFIYYFYVTASCCIIFGCIEAISMHMWSSDIYNPGDWDKFLWFRILSVSITLYFSLYWLFAAGGYFLVMSINFGNCITMKNEIDFELLDPYKTYNTTFLVIGILFPILSILWAFAFQYKPTPVNHGAKYIRYMICNISYLILALVPCVCTLIGIFWFRKVSNAETTEDIHLVTEYCFLIFPLQLYILIYPNCAPHLFYSPPRLSTPPNPQNLGIFPVEDPAPPTSPMQDADRVIQNERDTMRIVVYPMRAPNNNYYNNNPADSINIDIHMQSFRHHAEMQSIRITGETYSNPPLPHYNITTHDQVLKYCRYLFINI